MERNINRFSPIPLYYQIAADIKNYLITQDYKINDKIPSENNLANMYQVSRVTLRQALAELEKEGIITKVKGFGSILCGNPNPIYQTLQLPGFNKTYYKGDDKKSLIFKPEIIELKEIEALPQVNKALEIAEDSKICFIKRIFYHNNLALGINNSWIDSNKVPTLVKDGLIENRLSLTLSERYNLNPHKIVNTMESSILNPSQMTQLNIKFTTPSLIIYSTSFLEDGTPLEYSKTIWNGDIIKFKTTSFKDSI